MVQWQGDPFIFGYDPTPETPTIIKFVSPGMVDLGEQGITRLQVALPGIAGNYLSSGGFIRWTEADTGTPTPGQGAYTFQVSMFITPASAFPEGKAVTPTDLLQSPSTMVFRSAKLTKAGLDTSLGWSITGPAAQSLTQGAKFWVMILPTRAPTGSLPSINMDKPLPGTNPNTLGRGLSIWTNRTPLAPIITSPGPETFASPEEVLNLVFTSRDPDAVAGGTDHRYTDMEGVQVQYAPLPTPGGPIPEWSDLPVANESGTKTDPGWAIRGSSWVPSDAGIWRSWRREALPIKCGSQSLAAGHGALPSGDWQIRVRTFDCGHPFPNTLNPLNRAGYDLFPSSYLSQNTSPWSEPVVIRVQARVPTPIPISPTNNTALVEGAPVTFVWRYRSTAIPPASQTRRTLQVRKVGDTDWKTVVSGNSSSTSHTHSEPVLNEGFTSAGDWSTPAVTPAASVTVVPGVSAAATRPSGGTGPVTLIRNSIVLNPNLSGIRRYTIRGTRTGVEPTTGPALKVFFGSFAGPVKADLISSSGLEVDPGTGGTKVTGSEWEVVFDVPSYGAGPRIEYHADRSTQSAEVKITSLKVETGQYFTATNMYEWRVQTGDAVEQSTYSPPARFWVVPAGTKPVGPGAGSEEAIDGATLGCGTHRVFIYRRGGLRRVGEITGLRRVEWARVRDDISPALIEVADWDIDCGALLAKLEPWAYEIVIFRDNGFSVDRVWEGPITLLTYEEESVTIHAKDVMGYAYRRIIKQKLDDSGRQSTVVDRAARILRNVFAPDDPNILQNLQIMVSGGDAKQFRSIPEYSRTAFEEIDDMAANHGLDYAAVGRSILVWGTKNRIGTLPEFSDRDLGSPPIVSVYGMSMANVYSVSDGNGVHGEATRLDVSGNDPVYGLVEMLSSSWASDSETPEGGYTDTQNDKIRETFAGYAERSIADRYPAPVVVRIPDNTTVNPEVSVSIQQLIPGVIVPLRSRGTLRSVVADQKLDSVQVKEVDGSETVTITLSPFSREDNATDEGEGA